MFDSVTDTSTRLRNQKRYLTNAAIETDAKVYRPGPLAATYPQDGIIIVRSFQKLRAASNCLDVGGDARRCGKHLTLIGVTATGKSLRADLQRVYSRMSVVNTLLLEEGRDEPK